MPSNHSDNAPCRATNIYTSFAVERLLNTWLREQAINIHPVEGQTCAIPIGADTLIATCRRSSPSGFHSWESDLSLHTADGNVAHLRDAAPLAIRMIDTLPHENDVNHERMKRRLLDGLDRSRSHACACAARASELTPIGLEQILWHGHPFHPFAKDLNGFSDEDIDRYAPERATAFQLRWLIADVELVRMILDDPLAEAWVRSALVGMSGLSSQRIEGRVLIPSHPWQAAQLESNPAFIDFVAEGRLSITEPSGDLVLPTASVRTVYATRSNLFMKLPITARITNFARTNQREQILRSVSASRAIKAMTGAVNDCGMDVLREPCGFSIDHPALEDITGVLIREGPTRDAYVVAGLLELSPHDGKPMLATMGLHPCDGTEAAAWLRAYTQVAILPPLRLFARTGISLEAHSQNSLLALEDGLPTRLIVRDLEGVSIDGERFSRIATHPNLDPVVLYTAEEAWKRLLYYLIVNQVAHVVATVARIADVQEKELWHAVSDELSLTPEDDATKAVIVQLLNREFLPAKMNFSSCAAGRGEDPSYVAIANPLRFSPRSGDEIAWREAGSRVATQLLGALLNEELLPDPVVSIENNQDRLEFTIRPNAKTTYWARARRMQAYGRILVEPGSLVSRQGPIVDASAFLADLLPCLPGKVEDHARFAEELARTHGNHTAALAHGVGGSLSDLPYEAMEGALPDGHRYHPCFKSRIGFTPADNFAYGPEFRNAICPIWVAVHRSIAKANAVGADGLQDAKLIARTLGAQARDTFANKIAYHKGNMEDYFLLPVHPWQWMQVADGAMMAEQRNRQLILLGPSSHDYSAQQSIRTLADATDLQAPTLKLSLSIRNTSTARTLSPHTVLNAPIISAWLEILVTEDTYLRESGVLLLSERMGVAVTALPVWDNAGATRGSLSAIWRDPVTPLLAVGESAVPFTALTHRDGSDPFIADWIARYGVEPWLDQLLKIAMLPVVHFLIGQDVAIESHQQNMVLFHREGWPTRVALKDFHDGIRFIPRFVQQKPALVPTPPEHALVNPNSYVEALEVEDVRDFMVDALFGVNLAELGFCLDRWFDYPESRFWGRIIETLGQHCAVHPKAEAGALRYQLAADNVLVENLALRRIDPSGSVGRYVTNPLAPLASTLK